MKSMRVLASLMLLVASPSWGAILLVTDFHFTSNASATGGGSCLQTASVFEGAAACSVMGDFASAAASADRFMAFANANALGVGGSATSSALAQSVITFRVGGDDASVRIGGVGPGATASLLNLTTGEAFGPGGLYSLLAGNVYRVELRAEAWAPTAGGGRGSGADAEYFGATFLALPVPTPGTFALLLAGFAVTPFARVRRLAR